MRATVFAKLACGLENIHGYYSRVEEEGREIEGQSNENQQGFKEMVKCYSKVRKN